MGSPISPRILLCGERAVTIEFAERIDRDTNARVQRLAAALEGRLGSAIRSLIPAYRSLSVHYDPMACSYERLHQAVEACLAEDAARADAGEKDCGRTVEIPVCYGGQFGPDLAELAAARGLSPQQAIDLHSGGAYFVYMIGFTPGYCYLGGLDERLVTPRRKEPRLKVPAGSVGIADRQTGIYSIASPGGWQIVGRTPLILFAPEQADPFLLRPGDTVRFRPIPAEDFGHHQDR